MGIESSVINDAILRGQIDLLRLEAGVRARIIRLLDQMKAEIMGRLVREDLTAFSKARLQTLLSQATKAIDEYYTRIAGEMDMTLRGVADISAAHTADTLGKVIVTLDAGLPTETFLTRIVSNSLIMGAPSSTWWEKAGMDTAFKFANAVRQGVVQGETNEQIAARVAGSPRKGIPGIMDTSRANARSLVHSSIMQVANDARMETFQQNSDVIEGVQQLSTLDGNTTEICIAYSGMQWTLDGDPIDDALPFDGGPPRHWGCRSVLVPIVKDMGFNLPQGMRASAEGPVASNTTFEQFLSRRTKEQQDEQLGVGRAELWRKGTITLRQLLDQSGNPLTLAQLRAR